MYFGSFCGRKIEAAIGLFRILNALPLLPYSKKYIENALACVNFYESRCADAFSKNNMEDDNL
jgi:hypothetical protein